MDLSQYKILNGNELNIYTLEELTSPITKDSATIIISWFVTRIFFKLGIGKDKKMDRGDVEKLVEFLELNRVETDLV